LAVVRLYGEGFHEVDRMLEQALREAEDNSPLRVQVSVSLAYVLLNANQLEDSVRMADSAVTDAERLGQPHLLSLALGMRTILQFLSGNGLDDVSIHRALALEDPQAYTPLVFRPTVQHALLLEWTGQLERADEVLDAIRARCMERGEEGEEVFIAQHVVMSSIWRGDFVKANLIAEDAMGQARHLGGNTPLYFASCLRALLAAHSGHEADARQAINEAFEIGRRLGSARLLERVHAALTFLELSLGNYEAAVGAARPLVAAFDAATTPTELPNGAYLPDAIEALVTVGRADDAEPLVQALERNGRRLDRAWMRAAGARTRAMLCAARGNLDEAHAAALDAMADYNKITMPFERARTLLLLGQVERRQRKKESASSRLQEAGDLFEQMNVPLWADRARAELQRANVGPRQSGELTPSEQRVAELAASGLRNRDVAETLFISPKTVEANLARIYRKLGIKSRA
jgi:DNA-binding CsgD family transcriptional regulator